MKINKFLSIIMMLVIVFGTAFAFSSCSKDDDENSITEDFLVGRWYECEENGDLRDVATEYEVFCLDFQSGGKGIHYVVDYGKLRDTSEFSWSLSGDKLTFRYNKETETLQINYKNGILTIGDIYYKKK